MAPGSHPLQTFLAAAVRSPGTVGAVAPSSSRLSQRLAAVVPGEGDPVVVELGPGTGSTTAAVQRRLGGRGRHLAIELDPALAEHAAAAHPEVEIVVGNAADLEELLATRGVSQVDAVLSGLPWSLIPGPAQRTILEAAARVLRPGGSFSTFAYVHALPLGGARHFRALLDEVFDEVLLTRTVWRNLPPAGSYVCRRPRAVPGR